MEESARPEAKAEETSPAVPGLEPAIRHVDDADLPWEEFRRQRNADGSTSSVWEKWFALSSDPPYLSIYARYDPGMIVRRHGHHSPHVVFVLEGELWVGDTRCPRERTSSCPSVRPSARCGPATPERSCSR